ncbi:MAG TPA: hypothetical protein DF729_15385 [Hafnia paralvei]|nr:hypothetical protein [Hafnia paralvei]
MPVKNKMPINLHLIPDKKTDPLPINKMIWLVFLVCFILLVCLLSFLLWPVDEVKNSVWFWCCSLLFPTVFGLMLYGLRQLSYENSLTYIRHWNDNHEKLEKELIKKGQEPVHFLESFYCTPIGESNLCQAIINGEEPLKPIYLAEYRTTVSLGQLSPAVGKRNNNEYAERLEVLLKKIAPSLNNSLNKNYKEANLKVRIKHDGIISDSDVLLLWHQVLNHEQIRDVIFTSEDDGLLWIDHWLDDKSSTDIAISVEIHLLKEPLQNHVESVSVLILGRADWYLDREVTPKAAIHRPVKIDNLTESLTDALRWGKLVEQGSSDYFFWHSQVSPEMLTEVTITLDSVEHPINQGKSFDLDPTFGLPDKAVGNIALILACEKAYSENENQLILLRDSSYQVCTVRPLSVH